MKIGLVCYHKNADKIYPEQWINDFRNSILFQTNKEFKIYELNYCDSMTDDYFRIFDNSEYYRGIHSNHGSAMNEIIDIAFADGCDYVGNLNCDDVYSYDRIEKQIKFAEMSYDIISSNFSLFNDTGVFHTHNFDKLDIRKELDLNHNILCHPIIMYSKHFWKSNRYYPHEIPFEDMKLWQRSIRSFRFIILPDVLCFHREHQNSVGRSK